jgi:hypothetical protein
MGAPFGRMLMCHMIADTHVELMAMADAIGVQRRWLQQAGNHGEHFDVSLSKRAMAVRLGAVEVTTRVLAERAAARRGPAGKANYFTCTRK